MVDPPESCVKHHCSSKSLREQVTRPRPEEVPGPDFELCLALDPLGHHAIVLLTDLLNCPVPHWLAETKCGWEGRLLHKDSLGRELKCACEVMNETGVQPMVQKSF